MSRFFNIKGVCTPIFRAVFVVTTLYLLTASLSIKAQESMSQTILSDPQQSIIAIAAFTAMGDLPQLNASLKKGLEAGLSISGAKEIWYNCTPTLAFPAASTP